jgi:hypothetical protein
MSQLVYSSNHATCFTHHQVCMNKINNYTTSVLNYMINRSIFQSRKIRSCVHVSGSIHENIFAVIK